MHRRKSERLSSYFVSNRVYKPTLLTRKVRKF